MPYHTPLLFVGVSKIIQPVCLRLFVVQLSNNRKAFLKYFIELSYSSRLLCNCDVPKCKRLSISFEASSHASSVRKNIQALLRGRQCLIYYSYIIIKADDLSEYSE
jgi:hypothetical protein